MSLNPPVRRVITGTAETPGADILPASRACDADRDRLIAHLSECLRLGYIHQDVFQVRMAAAAEAKTGDHLVCLLADLPALPVPRRRWHELMQSPWPRRWLHFAGAVFGVCWMVAAPVITYAATVTYLNYKWDGSYWTITVHSPAALGLVWGFVITGLGLLAADVIWWLKWENGQKDGIRTF
jgi:hypothetical protein